MAYPFESIELCFYIFFELCFWSKIWSYFLWSQEDVEIDHWPLLNRSLIIPSSNNEMSKLNWQPWVKYSFLTWRGENAEQGNGRGHDLAKRLSVVPHLLLLLLLTASSVLLMQICSCPSAASIDQPEPLFISAASSSLLRGSTLLLNEGKLSHRSCSAPTSSTRCVKITQGCQGGQSLTHTNLSQGVSQRLNQENSLVLKNREL